MNYTKKEHSLSDNKYLFSTLDGVSYALPFSIVERVIRAIEITPLPEAPNIFLGVINVRGEIIPVVNIRRRFNHHIKEIDLDDNIILLKTSQRTIAIVVDSGTYIDEISTKLIIEAQQVIPGSKYIEGIAKISSGTLLILDLEKILSLEEEEFLKDFEKIKE